MTRAAKIGDTKRVTIILDLLVFLIHHKNSHLAKNHNLYYFQTDKMPFLYESLAFEFGPLKLSSIVKYCEFLNGLLNDESLRGKTIIHKTLADRELCANAALLIGSISVLHLDMLPNDVMKMLTYERRYYYVEYKDSSYVNRARHLLLLNV